MNKAIAACFLGLGLCLGSAAASEATLVIGVRADAPPFSFYVDRYAQPPEELVDGLPSANKFDGYVVRICDAALREAARDWIAASDGADLRFMTRVVDASERFDALRAGKIDILCDPTTILKERIDGLVASAPIYLSAITFAVPDPFPISAPCAAILGFVGNTTADRPGVSWLIQRGSLGRFTAQVRDALSQRRQGGTGGVVSETCDSPIIKVYPTHDALAREFCLGQTLYYVGDLEIVRANLRAVPNCMGRTLIVPATFGDERYTILSRIPGLDEPIKAAALLQFSSALSEEILGDPSILITTFGQSFEGYTASQKLQAFFWSVTGQVP